MTIITDEVMREMRPKARLYALVLLRHGAKYNEPDAGAVIWEHGRRNHSLRADGVLAIVCPVADDSDWAGIGIFGKTPEETTRMSQLGRVGRGKEEQVGHRYRPGVCRPPHQPGGRRDQLRTGDREPRQCVRRARQPPQPDR